jgi:hypothetical protein
MPSTLLIPVLIIVCFITIEIWKEARRRAELARAIEARERTVQVHLGGNPREPIWLQSPAQVEAHARSLPCPLCGGTLRVGEHAAETIGSARLRIAYVSCLECSASRAIYFRVAGAGR